MTSERFGIIIKALSSGRHPMYGKPLTQDTILQILQHRQVQRALLYYAGKSSNHNSKEAGLFQALADCQNPATGKPLDKQEAWNLLHNPSVLDILKRAADSSEATAAPPARFKRNTLISVVIPLLILWMGVLIWWGLEHYSRQPGSIHDPVLKPYLRRIKNERAMASRKPANIKKSDQGLHHLQQVISRYSRRGAILNKPNIPDQLDALVMSSPDRLLPLINTKAFALLELDGSMANALRQAGLKNLQVLHSGEEAPSHCHTIGSWTWPVREWLSSGMTANLFHSYTVDGCAKKMPIQAGRVIAVWVGSDEKTLSNDLINACTQVVFGRDDQSNISSEPWLDIANCADGTSVYLAAGVGPKSVIVSTKESTLIQKQLADVLTSLPVDQNIDSARYTNYIALYHLGRVSHGKLNIEPGRLHFKQLINGEGSTENWKTVLSGPQRIEARRRAEPRLNPDCRRKPMTHRAQAKTTSVPVTQTEDNTPRVLINRDPRVFDNVCMGDTLIFNVYAANIKRIMISFDNANAKDMSGIQIIQSVNFQNSVEFTIPPDWHGFTTISATGFTEVSGKPSIAGNKVTFNIKPKILQQRASNRAGVKERRIQKALHPKSNIVADKRTVKEFFEIYIELRNSFDPAWKKMYARDAAITYRNSTKKTMSIYSGARGRDNRLLLKRLRQEFKANNEKGLFSNIEILRHRNGYRIKATRYSSYYCSTDKHYYMTIIPDTYGQLKITAERLAFPSKTKCNPGNIDT